MVRRRRRKWNGNTDKKLILDSASMSFQREATMAMGRKNERKKSEDRNAKISSIVAFTCFVHLYTEALSISQRLF
jgi:hypothetical protein